MLFWLACNLKETAYTVHVVGKVGLHVEIDKRAIVRVGICCLRRIHAEVCDDQHLDIQLKRLRSVPLHPSLFSTRFRRRRRRHHFLVFVAFVAEPLGVAAEYDVRVGQAVVVAVVGASFPFALLPCGRCTVYVARIVVFIARIYRNNVVKTFVCRLVD